MLSDTAYDRIEGLLEAVRLEPITVKNRVQPVQVYSIDVLQLANV